MKEVTYGWYPSANDIYRSKGRPSTSHLDCLYKHKDSMYYQGKMEPPQPELMIMGVAASASSTPQDQRRMRSKTVSVPKFKPVPKLHIPTPTECWNKSTHKGVAETSWGIVGESSNITTPRDVSWPLPSKKEQQQQHQQQVWRQHFTPQQQEQLLRQHLQKQQFRSLTERQPSRQYAWGFKKAQSPTGHSRPLSPTSADIKWPSAKRIPSARPQTSSSSQGTNPAIPCQKPRPASSPIQSANQNEASPRPIPPAPPCTERNASGCRRPSRIQSATVHRDKTPLPARPKTASPRKEDVRVQMPNTSREEMSSGPFSRPAAPVPFIHDVNDTVCEPADDVDELVQNGDYFDEDEYEQVLKKYGWRAQVHGDPYRLKRPLPRMSYAVTCVEPGVAPEPPGIHMETNEPFFYNTIPSKPMTFDVDKEWMSEVIMAKRLELQKRDGGIKYNYKNFSFVY